MEKTKCPKCGMLVYTDKKEEYPFYGLKEFVEIETLSESRYSTFATLREHFCGISPFIIITEEKHTISRKIWAKDIENAKKIASKLDKKGKLLKAELIQIKSTRKAKRLYKKEK